MPATALIQQLELQSNLVCNATHGLTEDEWRWRQSPSSWSTLEVVGHLLDEERDDFRARIRAIFAGESSWSSIDPESWVLQRKHQEREPEVLLQQLQAERSQSILWLRGLEEADWNATMEHGLLGSLSAGDLLAAWVAHDLLHIAQVMRIRLELTKVSAAPWSTRYAAP